MSGSVTTALAAAATVAITNVLIRPPRQIGFIIPNVVVEEQHRDELFVTDHPVEYGAEISDHAFKRPAELTMRCGWSNSFPNGGVEGLLSGGILGVLNPFAAADETFVTQVYNYLLAMQESRQLLTIVTGKRVYQNMLMTCLANSTDVRSEYALECMLEFRQIMLVYTTAATVPASAQASPETTAAPIDSGTKQAGAAKPNSSALYSMFGGG